MRLLTGTSGFSYKAWKGSFYPEDLADGDMLSYYAGRLPAVEINNTFYRMPKESVLARWASEVGEEFRFVLKVSRRITHFKRLRDCEGDLEYLLETARTLGERLGPLLFQLPPNFRRDDDRLAAFLAVLPRRCRAAFEFRHESWFDEGVYDLLREHGGATLCIAETDERSWQEVPKIGDWGYLRLRREAYSSRDLESWAELIRDQPWGEVYGFFKHEDGGAGPRFAEELAAAFDQ